MRRAAEMLTSRARSRQRQPLCRVGPPCRRASAVRCCSRQPRFLSARPSRLPSSPLWKPAMRLRPRRAAKSRSMVDIIRFFAGLASELKGKTIPWTPGRFLFTKRVPVGVVGAIIPWNAPIDADAHPRSVPRWQPAILSCSRRPNRRHWPYCAPSNSCRKSCRLASPTSFPATARRPASRWSSTRWCARSPSPDRARSASQIMHYAADKLIRSQPSSAARTPISCMPDADLDLAVPGIIQGLRLFRQGQSCTAGTRVYIHEDVYREVIDRLVAKIGSGRVGNPLDELHRDRCGHLRRAAGADRALRRNGAGKRPVRASLDGRRATGATEALRRGYFYTPTLIEGVPPQSPVCRDEIFGPVATVSPWRDFDAVIAEANDTRYGLAAVLWTRDLAARPWNSSTGSKPASFRSTNSRSPKRASNMAAPRSAE